MPRGKKKKRVIETSPPPVRGRRRRGRAISHSPVRSPISPSSPESTHSKETEMAEQNNRNVSDYATPRLDGLQHSIRRPSIQANNFEIKPANIQLLQVDGQFGGSPIEDPNNHILNFLQICDTLKHNGVSDDAIRLRLFPFSLRDKEKVWLQSLPEGSISTWEELAQQFLTKYFPPGKTAKMRNDITSFVLLYNESLYEAWERFKELLRKCPHHGLPKWLQVQTFYNGLSSEIRTSIDAAAGGALMSKPVDAAYTLLETMSSNNHQWHSNRHVHARVAGVQDSDMFASLSSQIAVLTKEVKSLGIQGAVKAVSRYVQACENCGEIHTSEQCPLVLESVQALPLPTEKKPSLEEMMMSYMSKNDALMQSQNAMADRSIAYPRGIIENVLVKVDKLILPVDFIVLDYEEDKNVPIILGRPFLATGRTIIDVQKGELTMRVQDQEVKFNVFKAMKLPGETEECFHVNVVNYVVDCSAQDDELKYHPIDPSEVFKYPYAEACDVDFVGCAKILEAPPWKIRAPPWCHKPSPSYSREQDWTFMQVLQDKIVHESAITWNFYNATPTPFTPIDPGKDDELKYHPIDPSEVFKYPYAEACDVDFVGCAKILEAPPWKIRAPPWANVIAKQGPNAQRVKLPGFKETQWSIKRRIRMAYLEEQTQRLTACNGVIHQNFREFVKCTNGDKMDPHYQDLPPPPEH
ncbi:uncharacterized protein G2W53_041349 [Senna tora]|uniref:Retrotransposon gag domain-containing protein n=1 Tax=Senna tora TaxID=362788 RepID=A0A834SEP4_9FABA|nr:uncharacterized protein G2W53_041349 [Senna tora]